MANLEFQVPDSFRSGTLQKAIEKAVDELTNRTDEIDGRFHKCKYRY